MKRSEFELIADLARRLPPPGADVSVGPGDDAAVTVPGGAIAVSLDACVEGVHFRREHSRPRAIGHKALATALSDLAAMGAAPGEAYVAIAVPEALDEAAWDGICEGLVDLAHETGVAILGGDVSRGPVLSLTVTVIGHAASAEQMIARSGSSAGDVVAVTGELGGAAAGLLLLEGGIDAAELGDRGESLEARQLEPLPRLAEGRALASAGARAMIDLSDGLAADASHLAEASGVGLDIELGLLPLHPGVAEVASAAGLDPLELACAGGEDYELLVCLAPENLEAARSGLAAIGTALTTIGRVTSGEAVLLRDARGRVRSFAGFDHLRSR